jgi:branched-subunit amino acid transport protein
MQVHQLMKVFLDFPRMLLHSRNFVGFAAFVAFIALALFTDNPQLAHTLRITKPMANLFSSVLTAFGILIKQLPCHC